MKINTLALKRTVFKNWPL